MMISLRNLTARKIDDFKARKGAENVNVPRLLACLKES